MSGFTPGNSNINDQFSNLSEDQKYWLHECLFPHKQSERIIGDINFLNTECLDYLKNNRDSYTEISNKLDLLKKNSDTFFHWVSDSDIRKLKWIKRKIDSLLVNQNGSIFGILNNEKIFDSKFRLCVSFNKVNSINPKLINLDLNQPNPNINDIKIKFIESIKTQWNNLIIQTDNFSKWLEKLDQDALEWCYNYISKKESHTLNIDPEKKITPTMVLILIDKIEFGTNDKYIIYIDRLKKSWSQYKFKSSNKVKNKYHLPLTKQSISFLEKLAEFKNMSKSDIMEELLKIEYQKLMCDDQGKSKY
ncbi:hypothetical protein [Acinetobacter junii]|uniref:hypothetical protein n=1 Tax=Acinetobacter junii TaxID=40215 RepID=UPI0032137A47